MPKTDVDGLKQYLDTGWQLIPLHSYDYFDQHKGKKRQRGKSPLHVNWTKRPYSSADQIKHMAAGNNVGVRLRAADLVIDVDPRNFADGDDPFRRLCDDCGLDPDLYPTVETGSGGLHVYMTKPDDVSVRDSLPDYEGVEFKTLGRQVVSAGSLHPDTHRTYEWDFLRPDLRDAPAAPDLLVNLVRRPKAALATGGGEHTQEELATMLEVLDPEDFSDHDTWFTLMQACHHATAGDGRSEFIEWSTRDPKYADDGGIIGRRWDSLHAGNDGEARVTHRTLHKLLIDAGHEDAVPRRPAEDDFEAVGPDDAPEDGIEEHERKGPMERMNGKYCAVMEGSQFRIFWEEEDPDTAVYRVDHEGRRVLAQPPRKRWVKAKVHDFRNMLANEKVQRGEKAVPKADAWLEWGGRRSARGVVFDPEREHEGHLNLWTGWGVEPRKDAGSWARLEELLHEVLSDGDDAVHEYCLNWAAHMVQHPGSPAEVAICFQGEKGVGKGTFGRALTGLAGKHGMQITSSDQLTGRFNDHLRDMVLLFADEALKPYDKDGESRLKGLITEHRLAFEGKGRDVITAPNRLHIVMASNSDWFIPAGLDGERRFMMQRANGRRTGQHAWFERLHDDLADGGLSALLWDLLHRDVVGWAPRSSIPSTTAFVDQKLRNMGPMQQWWFNALREGELPFECTREDADWALDEVRAFKCEVRESYEQHCRRSGIRSPGGMGRGIDMLFAEELRKLVPGMVDRVKERVPADRYEVKALGDGRAWAVQIPALSECRQAMETVLGAEINWGTQD